MLEPDPPSDIVQSPGISQTERLWTPWRMRYVGGDQKEQGCVFCNRRDADDDVASLILARGAHCFTIMNLFPYNTGHVMIVPNEHLAEPEELDDDTTVEMARLVPATLRALRTALNPAGFNIGTNVGATAGAGIAAHLHQHIVPRWQGDSNFMPILAGTMVLPELIPVTYAKIRAELARSETAQIAIVAFNEEHDMILLADRPEDGSFLPRAAIETEPVWRSTANRLEAIGAPGFLTGWAGSSSTRNCSNPTLAFQSERTSIPADGFAWQAVNQMTSRVPPDDVSAIGRALHHPTY